MDHMTHYHHLCPEERAIIMLERDRGSSLRQIALKLKRSPSTLSREFKRNTTTAQYCAVQAGAAYTCRRKRCVMPLKLTRNQALCDKVLSWLVQRKWSPEQIAAIPQIGARKRINSLNGRRLSHESLRRIAYPFNRSGAL